MIISNVRLPVDVTGCDFENNVIQKITDYNFKICWRKFDPDKRSPAMNRCASFIKFKDTPFVTIVSVADLWFYCKTTDDIEYIADISDDDIILSPKQTISSYTEKDAEERRKQFFKGDFDGDTCYVEKHFDNESITSTVKEK